jgi:hypothetical protein
MVSIRSETLQMETGAQQPASPYKKTVLPTPEPARNVKFLLQHLG